MEVCLCCLYEQRRILIFDCIHRTGENVPPGFIFTTETCSDFLTAKVQTRLLNFCKSALSTLESKTGKVYGLTSESSEKLFPLLVSVRYGASVDMPRSINIIQLNFMTWPI